MQQVVTRFGSHVQHDHGQLQPCGLLYRQSLKSAARRLKADLGGTELADAAQSPQRLREGRIYPGERVPQALANYFQTARLERLRELGMWAQVQVHADELVALQPLLQGSGARLLFDHCGRPDPKAGLGQPGFAALLTLAETGRAAVKLSGLTKCSALPYPHPDTWPYVQALVEAGEPISARACLEYWLGVAEGRGVRVTVAEDCDIFAFYHLVKSNMVYGYDDTPIFEDRTRPAGDVPYKVAEPTE